MQPRHGIADISVLIPEQGMRVGELRAEIEWHTSVLINRAC